MSRRKKGSPVDGWLVLDKPIGMTSTQAVGKVRWLFDAQKAGHAGTLDPLATGLLPIALGEATKTVSHVMDGDKAYRFTVRWGSETNTDDAEGTVTVANDRRPTTAEIEALIPRFVGEIMQAPPAFSAIKIDGNRAYDLARGGEAVEIAPRPIFIARLTHVGLTDADTSVFEAECGKGTYVRAIARDMGRLLGCHGHVIALRRTRVGPFREEDAARLEELVAIVEGDRDKAATSGDRAAGPLPADGPPQDQAEAQPPLKRGDPALRCFLLPVEAALEDLTGLTISSGDAARLMRGQPVLLRGRDAPVFTGPFYAVSKGRLVAIGEAEHGELRPTRIFHIS